MFLAADAVASYMLGGILLLWLRFLVVASTFSEFGANFGTFMTLLHILNLSILQFSVISL